MSTAETTDAGKVHHWPQGVAPSPPKSLPPTRSEHPLATKFVGRSPFDIEED